MAELQSIEGLVASIERAFPFEPRPRDDQLAGHECAECDALRTILRGARWTDLADTTIDQNFDKLPLLTIEAFGYYLPAYMRRAVRNPVEPGLGLGKVLEFTVYSLCDREAPADRWWRERVERFTPDQQVVIVAFLRWVVGLGESDLVDDIEVEDARRGLEKYWNGRIPKTEDRA
jgi:hypothetical protein